MTTANRLAIINIGLESGVANNSRPETAKLSPFLTVKSTFKNEQAERENNLSGQIEDVSGRSHRPALPINNQKVIHPIKRHSNKSDGKPEETELVKLYEKCMKLLNFLGLFLGVRMTFEWKPQNYFVFYVIVCIECFTGFSTFYSVYVHYVKGDYVKAIEPLAIVGYLVSCSLKIYAFMRHWQKILALIFAIRKYFRPDIFGRQAEIVKSNLQKTRTIILMFTTSTVVCCTFYAVTPIAKYIESKEVIPLLPIEVVFCDMTQTIGFIVSTFVHMIMGGYAGILPLFYEAAMIFCFGNYIALGELISEDIQELDRLWNGENNIAVEHKRAFLKNICKKRQDMNNFLKIMKYVFETQLFIYFSGNYFSQIICLYDVTQNDWIGGYGPLVGLFMEMMFCCYMGTQVSIVGDKLCYSIYHSNWYDYDLESQQMIGVLLHESQQDKDLQLGPMGPLNLMTGVVIYKSIYSYYTVLREMF